MVKNKSVNLIKELALTDFKIKYQGSFLGYLWSLIKPLMIFAVLYFVFTHIFHLGGTIEHYPIYLLVGLVMWSFFSETTATSLDAIVSRGDLIRKVHFKRIVLIISRGTTALMTFFLNFIVVLAFVLVVGIKIQINSILIVFLVLELFLLSLGVSLFLSSLYVRFRDISHIWEVFLQALFYATPILYPLSMVPAGFNKILMLNPVAQIIQDIRYLIVTKQSGTAFSILGYNYGWIPYFLPIAMFTTGYFLFQKYAVKFAEEI